jgi:hypothetical protein
MGAAQSDEELAAASALYLSGGRVRVEGQLMGFMQKMAHVMFFFIFLFFSPFLASIIDYISIYFLFLHISKTSPRLTPYRLKGKKGVCRLETPYRLKN